MQKIGAKEAKVVEVYFNLDLFVMFEKVRFIEESIENQFRTENSFFSVDVLLTRPQPLIENKIGKLG